MTWFAFQGLNSGKAVDLAGTQEKQAVVEGFHGYSTEAQAEANPNAVNVITRVFADAWIADYNAAVKEQAQPGGANANILNPATAVKAAVTGALSDWHLTFGGFNGILVRGLKILFGGILVIAGLIKLTGTDKTLQQVIPVVGGPAGKLLKA